MVAIELLIATGDRGEGRLKFLAPSCEHALIDVEMKPSDNSIGIGPQPQLPRNYARATVLVNGPGVIVADRQFQSKISWY